MFNSELSVIREIHVNSKQNVTYPNSITSCQSRLKHSHSSTRTIAKLWLDSKNRNLHESSTKIY